MIIGVPHALDFEAQFTCGGGVLKSSPPLFQGVPWSAECLMLWVFEAQFTCDGGVLKSLPPLSQGST
jgi:hypothetical protein